MERSISGVASGWVDPMDEEALAIECKRMPPCHESVHSNSTKLDEPDIVTCNEVHISELKVKSTPKEFAQVPAGCPSKSLKETSHKLSEVPKKTCTNLNTRQKFTVFPIAKRALDETCTNNSWDPPSYILCGEEVHGNSVMFTYKVIVNVDSISSTNLECYGSPRTPRLAAQEHAAEAALWYLMHLGYTSKP